MNFSFLPTFPLCFLSPLRAAALLPFISSFPRFLPLSAL